METLHIYWFVCVCVYMCVCVHVHVIEKESLLS